MNPEDWQRFTIARHLDATEGRTMRIRVTRDNGEVLFDLTTDSDPTILKFRAIGQHVIHEHISLFPGQKVTIEAE